MQQWLSFVVRRPGVFSGARRVVVAAMLAAAAQTAGAETYTLVGSSELIGALATTRATYEDTFSAIGQRSGLGYEEMLRANPGVDPWLPGEGAEVLLPTQYVLPPGIREGILVNVAEYRLYFFRRVNGVPSVSTFPVSIGRMDWSTPIGRHRIAAKQVLPSWYPPESIRAEHAANGDHLPKVVPPGPKNPLGEHAMRLSVSGYLIHGTNNPVGIGMQVTHGCIRMYPQDIRWLFPQVPVGTTVEIVNQPYKFGWSGDELYLEVHPSLEGDTHAEAYGMTLVTEAYVRATATRPARIDWDLVEEAYRGKLGIPVRVGTAAPVEAAAAAPVVKR